MNLVCSSPENPNMPLARQSRNTKFANDGSYESVEKLLYKLAIKCHARVAGLGLSMDFDDVMQEMNMSYVRAQAAWKPDGGSRFSTYCTTACLNNFNQRVERAQAERVNLGMISYDEAMGGVEEDTDPTEFMIQNGDSVDSHEDSIVRKEEMMARLNSLSHGSRRLIMALLMDERQAGVDKAAKLRDLARGINLKGEELRRVKLEIERAFGVTWL